jgi:4-oxalocrotonate tautomerase
MGPMPYINVRILKDGVTKEQKAQVIKEITETMVRVLGKDPQKTHMVIDEVELDNWGFAGLSTTEWRKKPK